MWVSCLPCLFGDARSTAQLRGHNIWLSILSTTLWMSYCIHVCLCTRHSSGFICCIYFAIMQIHIWPVYNVLSNVVLTFFERFEQETDLHESHLYIRVFDLRHSRNLGNLTKDYTTKGNTRMGNITSTYPKRDGTILDNITLKYPR